MNPFILNVVMSKAYQIWQTTMILSNARQGSKETRSPKIDLKNYAKEDSLIFFNSTIGYRKTTAYFSPQLSFYLS